jgi:hypothetical protein
MPGALKLFGLFDGVDLIVVTTLALHFDDLTELSSPHFIHLHEISVKSPWLFLSK